MAAIVANSGNDGVLAKQNALNKLSDKLGGRTPVRIHFLDNSSKMLLVESSMQAKDVMRTLLEKFEINDVDHVMGYFALFESRNGSSIDGALLLDTEVAAVVNAWTDENSKLVFMIRLFVPCLWGLQHRDVVAASCGKPKNMLSLEAYLEAAEVTDPGLVHLQYMQAVYHVVTGQYPTSQEQALILGALHFLYKFGEYSPTRHKPGFLGQRIVEFVPIRYLKKKAFEEWEVILFNTLRDHQTTLLSLASSNAKITNGSDNAHPTSLAPQLRYMDYVFRLPNGLFGCTFFRCSADRQKGLPETVIVGIHAQGINLFDKSSDRKLIKSFSIEDIYRWGYKPNILFYFEINVTEMFDGVLEFKTGEGQKMSDLCTDYALAFVKERDREAERAETLNTISVDEYLKRERELKEMATHLPAKPIPKHVKKAGAGPSGKTYSAAEKAKAATKLQSLYRGFALRQQWSYEDAAIRLQSVYRGYRARIKVFAMIEALMNEGNLSM